jgi:tetratricopeptide (TPR) repeat protein
MTQRDEDRQDGARPEGAATAATAEVQALLAEAGDLVARGDLDRANGLLESAKVTAEAGQGPDRGVAPLLRAEVLARLGLARIHQGRTDPGVACYSEALALLDGQRASAPLAVAAALHAMGRTLLDHCLARNHAIITAALDHAREIYEAQDEAQSAGAGGVACVPLAEIHEDLGRYYEEQGRSLLGATHYALALGIREAAHGPDHPLTVNTRLGQFLCIRAFNEAAADPIPPETLAAWRGRWQAGEAGWAALDLRRLARVHHCLGQDDAAVACLTAAVAHQEATLGALLGAGIGMGASPALALPLEDLAGYQRHLGQTEAARASLERAQGIRQAVHESSPYRDYTYYLNLRALVRDTAALAESLAPGGDADAARAKAPRQPAAGWEAELARLEPLVHPPGAEEGDPDCRISLFGVPLAPSQGGKHPLRNKVLFFLLVPYLLVKVLWTMGWALAGVWWRDRQRARIARDLQAGRLERAERRARAALERCQKAHGDDDAEEIQEARQDLLAVLHAQGRQEEAQALAEETLAYVLRHRDEGDGPSQGYGDALNDLGVLKQKAGLHAEAEGLFRQSLAQLEEIHGGAAPALAGVLQNLAGSYRLQGKYSQAEEMYLRALALLRQAPAPAPDSLTHQIAQILNNLGQAYREAARYDEAVRACEETLALVREATGLDRLQGFHALTNLAQIHQKRGDFAAAEGDYRRALALGEEILGAGHRDLVQTHSGLATLYTEQGHYAEAQRETEEGLRILEATYGPLHPNIGILLNTQATILKKRGDYAEALDTARRSVAMLEALLGPEHHSVAMALSTLSALFSDLHRLAEARQCLERVLAIKHKVHGDRHPSLAIALNNLAECYGKEGQYATAIRYYEEALANARLAGAGHPNVAVVLGNLAEAHCRLGALARARTLAQEALAVCQKALGEDSPRAAQPLMVLARIALEEGELEGATRTIADALARLRRDESGAHHDLARGLLVQARIHLARQSAVKARMDLSLAESLLQKVLGDEAVDHPDRVELRELQARI